jgi:hypothetical protein
MKALMSYFAGARLVTTVLFLASLALSLASAVTTFLGMKDYSGFLLVAAGVTFGVQCLLFAISWWLGQNWRRGWGHIIGGGIIFLTCAFVSVFFSFASLYSTIDGGRSDNAAQRKMQNRVSDLEKQLTVKMVARVEAKSRELADSPAAIDWKANVASILESARGAPAKLREEANKQRRAAQSNLIEEERTLRTILDKLNFNKQTASTAQGRIDDAKARYDKAKSERIVAEDAVRSLETKIRSETIKRDAEAEDGGCGAECKAIQREIDNMTRDLGGLKAVFEQARIDEQQRLENYDIVQAPTGVLSDRDALKAQQAQQEAKIAEIKTQLTGIEAQIADSLGSNVATVRSQLNDFSALDFSKFESTVASCTSLREQLIAAKALDLTVAPDCSGSNIVPELANLAILQDRQKLLATECDTTTLFLDNLSFTKLRTLGNVCIAAAGFLDAETKVLQDELFKMEQSRGEGAHSFAKVQASLIDDNDPLAKMALALAIAIDFLVLLCALIGTNVGTSEHARALQYVLLHKRPDPDDPKMQLLEEPNIRQDLILFTKASEWLSARGVGQFVFSDDGQTRRFQFAEESVPAMQAELFSSSPGEPSTPAPVVQNGGRSTPQTRGIVRRFPKRN